VNDVCNKIKEKMKVTDLKSFIYVDNIMIWGDSVKEFKIRLAHWDRKSNNYGLRINLEKTVMLRLSKKEERTKNENKRKQDKTSQQIY
jgi:hypothetical protein